MPIAEPRQHSPAARLPWPVGLLLGVWPLVVCWLSISLMSAFLRYHDMGVNTRANDGFLIYFVAPPLVLALYGLAGVANRLRRRLRWATAFSVMASLLLVLAGGALACWLHALSLADYPSDQARGLMPLLNFWWSGR